MTARPLAAVALAGLLAAAGAAAVAWQGRPPEQPAAAPRAPALELGLVLRDDRLADDLRAAEQLWDGGSRDEARGRFDALAAEHPGSLEAAVGAAIAAWPGDAVARLRALAAEHPDSALVRLHLGLALFAAGDAEGARREWEAALARDPDTPAAIRAEDLLHPEQAPGRPFYFPEHGLPDDLADLEPPAQLAALERRAGRGGADDWLLYGVALQRAGRPVSAREAYVRAAELAPESLAAQTAAAVGRFTKADPSAAFSRLGPLARDHPDATVVRFHLGVLLLWLRQVDEAREQLERARSAGGGYYARQAADLLARLDEAGTP